MCRWIWCCHIDHALRDMLFMIWFHKILKLILKAAIMPYKYMHWTLKKTTYLTWQFSWTFIYTLSLRTMKILLNMCKKFCWIYYCCWPCHDVVTRSKMSCANVGSDVMITLLSDVIKTLSQRCCNVASTFSIGFLGYFTTDLFWFLSLHRNVRELPTCLVVLKTYRLSLKERCIYS